MEVQMPEIEGLYVTQEIRKRSEEAQHTTVFDTDAYPDPPTGSVPKPSKP
jgi:hypothetical protein